MDSFCNRPLTFLRRRRILPRPNFPEIAIARTLRAVSAESVNSDCTDSLANAATAEAEEAQAEEAQAEEAQADGGAPPR